VPYRANIYALKSLGVMHILASGATGSLREDIEPPLVICDQVIDKTFRRESTFFDRAWWPTWICRAVLPGLRAFAQVGWREDRRRVHSAGTYVCMEGPQFSTVAESRMHQAWGGT